MEMDCKVLRQPTVMLRFVDIEAIKDYLEFLFGILSHDLVHEAQDFSAW